MENYSKITNCRICNGNNLVQVLKLKDAPLANNFTQEKTNQELFPLEVNECQDCGHCQLSIMINSNILYQDYSYKTPESAGEHFRTYCQDIFYLYEIKGNDLIVDIGSNNGFFLQKIKENHLLTGKNVLGVEPATKIADEAISNGIPTMNEYFTSSTVDKILKSKGQAKAITANNVFAHVPSLHDFVENVKNLLDPKNGVFVFEVQYLPDQVDIRSSKITTPSICNFYHEHYDYHHLSPLIELFKMHDMKVCQVDQNLSHGGTLRVCVVHNMFDFEKYNQTNSKWISEDYPKIDFTLEAEHKLGLIVSSKERVQVNLWGNFKNFVQAQKKHLLECLNKAKQNNEEVVIFGAAAKSTVILSEFDIDNNLISKIIEDNELKHGYNPNGIEVVSSNYLYNHKPKYCLFLAENIIKFIVNKHKEYTNIGNFKNMYWDDV